MFCQRKYSTVFKDLWAGWRFNTLDIPQLLFWSEGHQSQFLSGPKPTSHLQATLYKTTFFQHWLHQFQPQLYRHLTGLLIPGWPIPTQARLNGHLGRPISNCFSTDFHSYPRCMELKLMYVCSWQRCLWIPSPPGRQREFRCNWWCSKSLGASERSRHLMEPQMGSI